MSLAAFIVGSVFLAIGPWAKDPVMAAACMITGAILMAAGLICREIEGKSCR